MIVRNWLEETRLRYFGNATSVRDYRSQLRGLKPLWIWLVYLFLLCSVTLIIYSSISNWGSSLSTMQMGLKSFYSSVMGLLGAVVILAAPALTSTAVTVERQRKSLDLVFSAPVTPRYFLVGKLLSSLRYTTMLIFLALPIVAVCVVLGGATWSDVIVGFGVLLMASVCFASLGLMISAMSHSLISATLITFAAAIIYTFFLQAVALPMAYSGYGSSSLSTPHDLSWFVAINPFSASMSNIDAKIFGITMPAWIPALLWTLLFSRIMILTAESCLSEYGSKETRRLRIGGMLMAVILGLLTARYAQMMSPMVGPSGGSEMSFLVAIITVTTLSAIIPMIACHSPKADRKFRSSRAISFKETLVGNPDGVWSYLILLAICFHGTRIVLQAFTPQINRYSVSPLVMPGQISSSSPSVTVTPLTFPLMELSPFFWSIAYLTLVWAVCRLASCRMGELKWARVGAYTGMAFALVLPLPFMGMLNRGGSDPGLFAYSPFVMPFVKSPQQEISMSLMLLAGILIAIVSERIYQQNKPKTIEDN